MHWKSLFEDSRPGSKSDIYICIGTTHKTFRTSSEQRENVRSSMGLKRSDFPTCWEVSAALQRTDLRSLPPLHVQKLTQQLKTFEGYRLISIGSKSFSPVSQNLLAFILKENIFEGNLYRFLTITMSWQKLGSNLYYCCK